VSLRVGFVAVPGREEDAAWAWLKARPEFQARRYESHGLAAALGESDVVWLHAAAPLVGVAADALRGFVTQGRGLLLTLRATELVEAMGLEAAPLNDLATGVWSHGTDEFYTADFREMRGYPHVRGIATYGPHSLVDGLHNGTYTWAPSEGEAYTRACYTDGVRPLGGRVVGVERAYIAQNPERVVAWEYAVGQGRVLCVGAFVHFAAPDPLLRPQLERLMANAIGATRAEGEDRAHWPEPATAATPSESLVLPDPLDLDGALPEGGTDPIALESAVESDEQFDIAGRRVLLVGRDRTGIRELWAHPHRAVAAWDVAADGEPAHGTRITVTPDVVVRTLETPRRRLTETCFVALEQPLALVEYHATRKGRESVGRSPAGFEVLLRIDLRRMWPFAAGCGGNLHFRHGANGLVAIVQSESDDGVVAVFASRPCAIAMREVNVASMPVVECAIGSPLGVPLRLAVIGGINRDDLDRTLRAVRGLGVRGLVRQRLQRATTMREARVAVRCEEDRLPRAVEWAKRRLDGFLVDVPGLGRSLVAGYAPSQSGWGDGRPGYAWFFGRDACWSAFGLLAAGEYSVVRQVVRFLGDRQDVTGKVLHEATTSGQFHYDAADATPLYLLLVARYLAWTGDVEFVRSVWPKVERAYAFCCGTDSDGDGLIENTRVGHGWIESGPLGGGHVTLYLAAVWRAALEALARAAEVLGEARLAAECWARAARAGAAIEGSFYHERRGIYALDKRADGTRTWTQTALTAVAILLGAVNPVRARKLLDALAGETFSARWGVRLLPTGDPLFSPTGYHAGAVWPLFTGWVALAEFRAGRGPAGFRHLMANARLAFVRQGGAFDEVLHGLEERSAGVCPDQAWSAAMLLAPLVEGLLGVEPDAPGGKLTFVPQLPDDVEWLEATGVRCGESVYDLRVRRRAREVTIAVRHTLGPPLWLTVGTWLASLPETVEVDGEAVQPEVTAWGTGMRCAVVFQAGAEHEVRFVGG
jgi:hypothetical protein